MIDRRPFSLGLLGMGLAVLLVLALVVGAGAIALRGRLQPTSMLRVPGDYSSIQAAIDAAQPGDIIQVAPGTYTGAIVLNKAVSLVGSTFDTVNPINNTTILDGGGGASVITIPAGLTQMPAIRGFAIRNGGNGIQAQSPFIAEYNYFYSSTIHVNYQLGAGGTNRSNVYFGSRDDAIHIDNLERPLLIENNRIMYAGNDGIEVNLQNAPVVPATVEVDIWNNVIAGSQQDGILFVDYPGEPQDTNRRFVIAGDLIANTKRAGVGLMPNSNAVEDYSGAGVAEAIRVYNDTFYGNDVGISGGGNIVAFNNIITNSTARGAWKVQGPPGSNSVVAFTLFFNNALDADQTTLGAGIITGRDPLFVAPPNPGPDGTWGTVDDDFSGLLLQAGSPAIDKGVTQYIAASGEPVPPTPITGYSGAAPDLGWREFGSAALVTPTSTLAATITLAPTNTPFVLTQIPSATPTTAPVTPSSTIAVTPHVTQVTNTPHPHPSATPSMTPPPPSATPTTGVTATPTPVVGIISIVPNSAQAGTTINVTITGWGFVQGTAVTFEGGQGTAPEVKLVQVVNPQTLVVTVDVKADASYGTQLWDVRVTNPDQTTFLLQDAFKVIPEP